MRRGEKRTQAKSVCLLAAVLSLGCSIDDVEIVGACVPDGDAIRVVSAGGSPQPGLLDGNLLLAWVHSDGSGYYAVEAAWFAPDLSMSSTVPRLGRQLTGFGMIEWARDGDSLVGQAFIGVDAMGNPFPLVDDGIRTAVVSPSGPPVISQPSLPVSTTPSDLCPDTCTHINISGALLDGSSDLRAPALALGGHAIMSILGVPNTCRTALTSAYEPMLFTASTRGVIAPSRMSRCLTDPATQPDATAWPNNIALVRGAGGMIGMLFRRGESSGLGSVNYVLTDELGNTMLPAVQVGPAITPYSADVGWDLHGVTLGEVGGVLYRERVAGNLQDYLLCYRMRAFHGDGHDAGDTAFQIGCVRHQDQSVTRSMDLAELSSGDAVVVWGERTAYGGLVTANLQQTITSSTPWTEGIFMTMVTPSGRRGSDVIRVTPPEATMLGGAERTATSGPFPADFAVRAASEGDHVVVTWTDTRPDAPGIYARSYRCRRSSADDASSSIDAGR